jgi:hypothetical protein
MASRELGERRDVNLEMEDLLRESGPILETAVQMCLKIYPERFTQVGPDLRNRLTGETIEEFVAGRRKSNPNDYADWVPDDPDQLMHTYTSEAFGETCSPKTVTRLFQFMNDPVKFAALAKAWGTPDVLRTMLPGKRPGAVPDSGAVGDKSKDTSARSPFNPARKFDNELDRQAEIAAFIATHTAKAVRDECQKYNADIAGRPLRSRK